MITRVDLYLFAGWAAMWLTASALVIWGRV